MAKIGGTKGWAATAGVALLLAFVALPALSGAASAAPAASAVPADSSTQWAYGGQGWFNGSLQSNFGNITWTSSYGWTVVFTVTQTGFGTWMVEEQRTVGITISAIYTASGVTVTYNYHGAESDVGFANVTNQSTVYVNGQPVPALGINNASASINASIAESISKTVAGHTASASLNVLGVGQASTTFTPSLGLIPLNLSGVDTWNSTATGSPSASWTVSYSWSEQGYNGSTASGSGARTGSLSGTGTVSLTGYKVHVDQPPIFRDHKSRTAVILVVDGVFDNYDAFLWIPHDFDVFGTAPHDYDSVSLGSAGISSETLYVSPTPGGIGVTAAQSSFGSNDGSVNALASPISQTAPAASGSPSGSVLAQPMSVSSAYGEANCLRNGCSGAAASGPIGGLLVALVGVAVAVVVGTVGVIEWRSYARRKAQKGLVGGYGESWPNGVPPAAALSPPALGPNDGKDPSEGPQFRP
ncbi:MAG TPA: hypothetical protein VEH28_08630 [Thermoplasmata archaeon]|nr:hypothetical protein [Thermoplasmata archaeon]